MSEHPPTSRQQATIILKLSSTKKLSSAQQRMYELIVSSVHMRPKNVDGTDGCLGLIHRTTRCSSLSFPITVLDKTNEHLIPLPMQLVNIVTAIKRSNNRLIIRQWKRGACWWNCNTNSNQILSSISRGAALSPPCSLTRSTEDLSTLQMAHAEVEGYRLAHSALRESDVNIAEVLYFSHDEKYPAALNIITDTSDKATNDANADQFVEPWAALSYFDHGTTSYTLNKTDVCNVGINSSDGWNFDLHLDTPCLAKTSNESCNHYPTTMVKNRQEFGFDEPHPRHGRVPIDECVDYVKMILRDVVFPLQKYFFLGPHTDRFNFDEMNVAAISCSQSQSGDITNNTSAKAFQYQDLISVHYHALHGLSSSGHNTNEERTKFMLNFLERCISTLENEWMQHRNNKLPPVLCHMDLQPQNLAFWHDNASCNNGQHKSTGCHVAAVMDWEEASYADPRFELILICRKVLANRKQADLVWQLYEEQVQKWNDEIFPRNEQKHWKVGPLEPWLKLECVHSLCTLVIQLLDSACGGRSPWETEKDLLGKIDRERQRLVMMGWSFCAVSLLS